MHLGKVTRCRAMTRPATRGQTRADTWSPRTRHMVTARDTFQRAPREIFQSLRAERARTVASGSASAQATTPRAARNALARRPHRETVEGVRPQSAHSSSTHRAGRWRCRSRTPRARCAAPADTERAERSASGSQRSPRPRRAARADPRDGAIRNRVAAMTGTPGGMASPRERVRQRRPPTQVSRNVGHLKPRIGC